MLKKFAHWTSTRCQEVPFLSILSKFMALFATIVTAG